MRDLLAQLSEAFGPSGCEHEVRRILAEELKGRSESLEVDPMETSSCHLVVGKPGPAQ